MKTARRDASRTHLGRALRAEDAAARRAFIEVVVAFFVSCGAQLPWPGAVDGALVQRLAGLCAVADWLGSDVEHFSYAAGPVDIAVYWRKARERAAVACDQAGLLRPTHVGVSRTARAPPAGGHRRPHARGGEPFSVLSPSRAQPSSPRTWG